LLPAVRRREVHLSSAADAGPLKARVLFVCLGNAVRSQMAEGFARVYGRDVVVAASAGLTPAVNTDPAAIRVMADIGSSIAESFPKLFGPMLKMDFDLIVNISGRALPGKITAPVIEWPVVDPVGGPEEEYRKTRDLLQRLTLHLVDEVRAQIEAAALNAAKAPATQAPVEAPATPGVAGSAVASPAPSESGLGGRPILDHRRRIRRS
jgi:arsenate reductase